MRVAGKYSLTIRRPVEEVFDFVATGFFENRPKWLPEIVESEQTSPGAMQVGATGRHVYRNKELGLVEATFVVREYNPPHLFANDGTVTYTSGASGGQPGTLITYTVHGESRFESIGSATRLHLSYAYELPSYVGWRLTKPFWQGNWHEDTRKTAWALKNYLESEAGLTLQREPLRIRRSWLLVLVYFAVVVSLWWAYSSRVALGLTTEWASVTRWVLSTVIVLGAILLMVSFRFTRTSRQR